jgi:hypothetical protein
VEIRSSRVLPLAVLFAALMAIATLMTIADPAAAATTLKVDDNGTECPDATYTTIQAAVDAASSGDTIKVCPGTYPESVSVNKTLTLEGAQAGVDARTGRSDPLAEAIVDPPDSGFTPGFNVTASDVTIDGFTVQGADNDAGILLSSTSSGYQILNNIIQNNTIGLYPGSSGTTETLIQHNLFKSNNVPGAAGGSGIYVDTGSRNMSVDENKFTGNETASINFAGAAGTQSDLSITNNEADNSIVLFNSESVNITGNTVNLNQPFSGSGVFVGGGNDGVFIADNTIINGLGSAVSVSDLFPGPNSNIEVIENVLENNARGISIASGALADPLEAHFNRLDSNTQAGIRNNSNTAVNAENNWWGCNEGPNQPGCSAVTGTGAALVDFDPWLVLTITADDTTLDVNQQTTLTADMTKNSDDEDTSSEGTIPDGEQVTFASDRGTVNPTTATITNGEATSTLTAQNPGTGSATATVDNETASVTIIVSPLPTISINDVANKEGNKGTTGFTFTVTLDKPSSDAITVAYATQDGTATVAGSDYTSKSGTITFAPGETSKTVMVDVRGEKKREQDETFFVKLSNATNATIADDSGQGTITNDDGKKKKK